MFAIGLLMVLFVFGLAMSQTVRFYVSRSEWLASVLGGVFFSGLTLMLVSILVALWRVLP